MIIDVPTPDQFSNNGIEFLGLAWDSLVQSSIGLSAAIEFEEYINNEFLPHDHPAFIEDYWNKQQRSLSVAFALAQQGTEFLLKSKIAEVSPFLLIVEEPRHWPKKCDRVDTSFSQFKTLDAQDLIKVHDTVSGSRLPTDFVTQFDKLRELRNQTMHSVHLQSKFNPQDGIKAILQITEALIGPRQWLRIQRERHEPGFWDYGNNPFASELMHIISEFLTNSESDIYFGFNPRRRCYYCYNCTGRKSYDYIYSAQLKPNSPKSKIVYCFCCDEESEVERVLCKQSDCKGNVLSAEWGFCLTCRFEDQD